MEPINTREDPNIGDNKPPRIVPVKSPRITVVSNVYHQIPGEPPAAPPPTRFYRWIESEEQAYSRTVKIGLGWNPIDLGWLVDKGEYSIIILTNSLKRLPTRKPSAAEEQEFFSKVLEVGLLGSDGEVTPIAYIPVGEDMRLSPLNLDKYRIRSRSVDGKYSIFLVGV